MSDAPVNRGKQTLNLMLIGNLASAHWCHANARCHRRLRGDGGLERRFLVVTVLFVRVGLAGIGFRIRA
jgi:hypothetical protein